MRAILVSHGGNGGQWLAQFKSHPRTTLVAMVNGNRTAPTDNSGVSTFATLDAAMENVQANSVLIAGGAVADTAGPALNAGLAVIVADPESLALDDVERLAATRNPGGGSLLIPRILQYRRCYGAIRQFLKSDRLGAIGHVSCIDRRQTPANGEKLDHQNLQFGRFGASQLSEICDLFNSPPVSIMSRLSRLPRSGSSTEVFLELGNQNNIHYSGSSHAGNDEHTLWIEGTSGSLKTNGRSIWWRKRGWRFFVPVRPAVPRFGPGDVTGLDHISKMVDRPAANTNADDLPVIQLIAAAIESNRTEQPVILPGGVSGAKIQ